MLWLRHPLLALLGSKIWLTVVATHRVFYQFVLSLLDNIVKSLWACYSLSVGNTIRHGHCIKQ